MTVNTEWILDTEWYAVLAAFVAINTSMYVILALVKTLPRIYFRDLFPRRYQRAETRSIYPDAVEGGPGMSRRKKSPDSP
ncbi:hypothetical protein [Corynebacterium sp.]|uniref:hypothetical protein n=1 Tax=Corynebacterium sp. TaxID=1720 RepID=UPI0026DED36B|nr:hypothetical protein [Corynebacterium sp.]MDO5513131.1 hypothetical protein [Corynebacterium sp.]